VEILGPTVALRIRLGLRRLFFEVFETLLSDTQIEDARGG